MSAKKKQPDAVVPPEVQKEAKGLVQEAVQLFKDHFKRLADDLAAFRAKRQEVQERINRGARRTDGRIV